MFQFSKLAYKIPIKKMDISVTLYFNRKSDNKSKLAQLQQISIAHICCFSNEINIFAAILLRIWPDNVHDL